MLNKWIFVFNTLLSIAFFFMIRSCHKYKNEYKRVQDNQNALMSDIVFYQTNAREYAASIDVLTMRNNELKNFKSIQAKKIKDLEIKLKNTQSYSSTITQTDIKVNTVIDTVRILDGKYSKDKFFFHWKDSWCSISGEINKDSIKCDIENRDTLHQVVHRIPRRFLFFKYGTKSIKQDIVSSNPHTKIIYSEYIKLDK